MGPSKATADNLQPLVLCADDYALSPGVSEGILALVERGRLSATSCMSLSSFWPEHARSLASHAGRIDVGLHVTLTGLKPLSAAGSLAPGGHLPALGHLAQQAYLGRLDLGEVRTELASQFDAFEDEWGAPPDFVDGHQHAHVLPGIRDLVIELAAARAPAAYIRQCADPLRWILRRGVAVPRAFAIAAMSRSLRRKLRGRRTNDSFRGVTSFQNHETYPDQFRRYLVGPGKRPLIMCHPGRLDDLLPTLDPVTDQRELELAYFESPAFLDDLAEAGCRLSRMTSMH